MTFAYADKSRPDKLILIDFGRASEVPPNIFSAFAPDPPLPSPLTKDSIQCHGYTSPWESRKMLPSFRDDLFRLMMCMAELIYGSQHHRAFNRVCSDDEYLSIYWALKMEENIFDISIPTLVSDDSRDRNIQYFHLADVLRGNALLKENQIRVAFMLILDSIRSLRLYEKPNYELLSQQVLNLIKAEST